MGDEALEVLMEPLSCPRVDAVPSRRSGAGKGGMERVVGSDLQGC